MRDAFGGIVNLAMIVVFLVLVSGYLAFNVNYTKAFRVKNYIISTIEQYEGSCNVGSDCDTKIVTYMKSMGYNAVNFNLNGYTCQNGYCLRAICSLTGATGTSSNNDIRSCTSVGSNSSNYKKGYYKVATQINVDIPILNKILPGLKIFQVSGNTKVIDGSK